MRDEFELERAKRMKACAFGHVCRKVWPFGCPATRLSIPDCPAYHIGVFVKNETIEDVIDRYAKTPLGLRRTTQMMDILRAFKMEEPEVTDDGTTLSKKPPKKVAT